MQSHKAHKIDFKVAYPCPCRRKGQLTPIALTDAFGCDRCQQIFVVQDNGFVLEQLSTNYPYKRTWRWTGHQWVVARSGLGRDYLPIVLVSVFVVGFLVLLLILQSPLSANMAFRVFAAAIVLSVMLGLMLWLACRR
ncbi:MAG: hypothetical protein MUF49_32630 [Oculatellaceae cyanobacterium Prado106]|nr:hypothetical protein [Oculatellaceae cyanobacterium Prado106]